MSLKTIFISVIFIVIQTLNLNAQNPTSISRDTSYFTLAPRIGAGIHDKINCEVGLSALYISNIGLQWGAASLYSTYIFQKSNSTSGSNLNGFKIGFQNSWAIFMWGLEWKTLYKEDNAFNYFSPKIGLSWLDVINLEYLINVAEINSNYPLQSKHQFGANISLNKRIYNTIWK